MTDKPIDLSVVRSDREDSQRQTTVREYLESQLERDDLEDFDTCMVLLSGTDETGTELQVAYGFTGCRSLTMVGLLDVAKGMLRKRMGF